MWIPRTSSNASPPLSEIDAPHFGIAAHVLRPAFRDHPSLMQHRDLLRDREHDLHVVLGEQQGEAALTGEAFEQLDGLAGFADDIPAVGSSSRRMSGLLASAIPSSTCFWLP